jgi:uncharacterized membrane protein YkoI
MPTNINNNDESNAMNVNGSNGVQQNGNCNNDDKMKVQGKASIVMVSTSRPLKRKLDLDGDQDDNDDVDDDDINSKILASESKIIPFLKNSEITLTRIPKISTSTADDKQKQNGLA